MHGTKSAALKVKALNVSFSCNIVVSLTNYGFKNASEVTLFKNYALFSSVASNYEKCLVYQDAIDALNGNREYGNISLDAYHEINSAHKMYILKESNDLCRGYLIILQIERRAHRHILRRAFLGKNGATRHTQKRT